MNDTTNIQPLMWAAVIMSFVSLVVSVIAFNRTVSSTTSTSTTLTSSSASPRSTPNDAQKIEIDLARARIESRLQTFRAKLQAAETIDTLESELADIRTDLRAIYFDGTEASQTQLTNLEKDLSQLETQLRQNSQDALTTIERLLSALRVGLVLPTPTIQPTSKPRY